MNHGCHTSRALGTPTCNSEVAELVWYNTRTAVYALWKKICQCRQRKNWMENRKEWTGYSIQNLLNTTQDHSEWHAFSASTSSSNNN